MIDESVMKKIMEAGCVTGDRINGLADGVSGEWFTELDLLTPASRKGLPLTLVICRMTLQDILVNAVDVGHGKMQWYAFHGEPPSCAPFPEGDAAHPMQPNLGLGGCMAIEDCYQLILELDKVAKNSFEESEVTSALR
ncbi:hypothetical protein TSUD_265290, partial [Trifolium subterraneum]